MPTINSADGTAVKVTDSGKLRGYIIAESEPLHEGEHGLAYSVLVDVTTASTDDDFFYMMNTNGARLVIFKIEGWCDDANQEISVFLGASDAGTDAGDTITPQNLSTGYNPDSGITCTQDATDLAITGGAVVSLLKFPTTALELASFDFPAGLHIEKNGRLHMQASLDGLINLNIYYYYHDV